MQSTAFFPLLLSVSLICRLCDLALYHHQTLLQHIKSYGPGNYNSDAAYHAHFIILATTFTIIGIQESTSKSFLKNKFKTLSLFWCKSLLKSSLHNMCMSMNFLKSPSMYYFKNIFLHQNEHLLIPFSTHLLKNSHM